jgi:hypothetical protein
LISYQIMRVVFCNLLGTDAYDESVHDSRGAVE